MKRLPEPHWRLLRRAAIADDSKGVRAIGQQRRTARALIRDGMLRGASDGRRVWITQEGLVAVLQEMRAHQRDLGAPLPDAAARGRQDAVQAMMFNRIVVRCPSCAGDVVGHDGTTIRGDDHYRCDMTCRCGAKFTVSVADTAPARTGVLPIGATSLTTNQPQGDHHG